MDVVFPLAALNVSGGVKNLLLQANALQGAGHRVWLILPDYSPAAPFPLPKAVEIRRLWTGQRWLPRKLRQLVYYLRLAFSCTAGAQLCVVAYFPTVYCAVAANLWRRGGSHILYSVAAYEPVSHGAMAEAGGVARVLRSALARASYRLPVRKVYASRWLRDMVGDPKGFVLGRGIDTRVFNPVGRSERSAGEPIRIGVIGRAGRVKGYQDFLAAMDGLAPEVSVEVRLVAVDSVPLPPSIRTEVLPVMDGAGMADFYRDCDIFVFPSLSEGFPAPPLEAMGCGCAVLVTNCGGVAEYARHEENCLMVEPGDPTALRTALERLCKDRDLRERLARRGYATAAAFGIQQMLDRWLALIGQIPERGRWQGSGI